jgi:hypothetical protein
VCQTLSSELSVAVLQFLMLVRLLRFARLSPKLYGVWRSLGMAFEDFTGYLIMVVVLIYAFSVM